MVFQKNVGGCWEEQKVCDGFVLETCNKLSDSEVNKAFVVFIRAKGRRCGHFILEKTEVCGVMLSKHNRNKKWFKCHFITTFRN